MRFYFVLLWLVGLNISDYIFVHRLHLFIKHLNCPLIPWYIMWSMHPTLSFFWIAVWLFQFIKKLINYSHWLVMLPFSFTKFPFAFRSFCGVSLPLVCLFTGQFHTWIFEAFCWYILTTGRSRFVLDSCYSCFSKFLGLCLHVYFFM